MEIIDPSPGKLKQIKLSRISVSGVTPDQAPSPGQAVIVNASGNGLTFGSAISEGGAGGAGGGGFTGFHDYGGVGNANGTIWFTGDFAHSFASMNVTGNIKVTATGMATGKSMTIKVTCPTGNIVAFHNSIAFLGGKPLVFPSGLTGLLVFTSFGTGQGAIDTGDAGGGIMPSGVICGYGVQDL